ncbi:MAG: hypothetical protein Q9226_003827 [Calogaya cf. arnoldii]
MSGQGKHAAHCEAVTNARRALEQEQQTMRDRKLSPSGGSGMLPPHGYEQRRFAIVKAILETKTFYAARSTAQNVRDILRIGYIDVMGLGSMLPAMYLRLGRDQASYDLVKMWDLMDDEDDEMDWSYLDVVNADVFESPRYLRGGSLQLGQQFEVALLKMRLLLDLVGLRSSNYITQKLPQELLDRVKFFTASTDVIRNDPEIMSGTKCNYSDLIFELSGQIDELYAAVDKTNMYFWDALL